ncbi:MAG: hypothetical protein E6094_00395 [Clostridium perfringens]|nr:hypothetical protein [Clostridium perfringens]
MNSMSPEEIREFLSKLRIEYEEFNILGKKPFWVNLDENINSEFLKMLQEKEVISSCKYLNNRKFKINRKMK